MTDPLHWLDESLDSLRRQHLYRQLSPRHGAQGATIDREGTDCVNFASNDYLGLAGDPRLSDAVVAAIRQSGWGSGASPLIVGYTDEHAALEEAIAQFEGTEAARLYPTGFAANCGTIPILVGKGDTIFSDERNHASIIDGCRLSGARIEVYPHADVDALRSRLEHAGSKGRKLMVTDGLFSMDGDVAPLRPLAELADKFGAMLMVDEAHATGVLGDTGRGAAEQCGVADRVDIKIGTLSKALGTQGGFVAGSRQLIDWITNRSRAYVFSTAAPAAVCAAGRAAIQIVQDEPHRRAQLLQAAAELRQRLAAAGWNTGNSTTQVIPLVIGDAERTMELAAELKRRGILVPGIRPPSVPNGCSLLRLSICWNHTPAMLGELLRTLAAVGPPSKGP